MIRKWLLVLFLIPVLLFSIAAVQNEKAYSASAYTTRVVVQPGGDLSITETVTFDFVGGPFTFVYRDIPIDYTDGITTLTARMDGRDLPEGSAAGQFEVEPGSPTRVTWHLAPTSDQSHTFELSYRVLGAVRQQPGTDLLEWNLLPTEYEYRIQTVEAVIEYPTGLQLLGPPSVVRGQAQVETAPGRVTFTAAGVGPNQPLQAAMSFPAGSLIAAPPGWQARQANISEGFRQVLPFALMLAAVSAALGILLFSGWSRSAGTYQAPFTRASELPRQMNPPASLPAAYAGLIAKRSDQAGWDQALGTLIELSRGGWVQLVEQRSGIFNARSFEIHLLRRPAPGDSLRPHERALLEMLFKQHGEWNERINASQLTSAVSKRFKQYKEPLLEELDHEQWFDPRRRTLRQRMGALGLVFLSVGSFVAVAALVFTSISANMGSRQAMQAGMLLAGLFAGLSLAGLVGVLMSASFKPLTERAMQQSAMWESFSIYLRDVVRNREPVMRPDLFEVYLPYAASFGIADAWAKYFQKHGMQQAPAWFTSSVGDANMGGFVAVLGAANSSGSSGVGGGAGAGGAGGGGGSGAG